MALKQLFSQRRYDAFIPISLNMTEVAVRHAKEFKVAAMVPTVDSFEIAADKRRTFALAKRLGMTIPATVDAVEYRALNLPCVIKHRRKGAYVAHDVDDLDRILAKIGNSLDQYLAQEYIPGRNGYGYFGFFSEGSELGFYMHQRIMQWPIEGGPSVVARSFYLEELRESGKRILTSLGWTGVAMVEFKQSSRDGKFYLIEVNPKYWGSLDLAIHAGCNFPLWVRDFLLHNNLHIPATYRMDTTFHWVVPNGLKCLARYPEYRSCFIRNCLNPKVKSEINFTDPLPTLVPLMARLVSIR